MDNQEIDVDCFCGGSLNLCLKFCLYCTLYVSFFVVLQVSCFSIVMMLEFLIQLLERHFGATLSEVGRQQLDGAKQHAAAVTATLNAVNAYAEWVPLPDLAKYGIIHGYNNLSCSSHRV